MVRLVNRLLYIAFLCLVFFPSALAAQTSDPAQIAETARKSISKLVDPDSLEVLEALQLADTSALGAEGFGHALLLNRQLLPAGYMFALSAVRDPQRAAVLSNLGVVSSEILANGHALPNVGPPEILALQTAAHALLPQDVAIAFNYATALIESGDEAQLEEAIAILSALEEADPKNAMLPTRLAEALMAAGREEEARAALARAFLINSTSPTLRMSNATNFGGGPIVPEANSCNVDFHCADICPGGIIGQINRVTCEMESSGAQLACEAGEPFATRFNCDAQFPEYGILIPGLHPGFSILTPWGGVDILIQGDGRIDYKVKAQVPAIGDVLQAFVQVEGSYQPSNGELRWDLEGGLQFSLFNRNPIIAEANRYDIGPGGVVKTGTEEPGVVEMGLEVGRGPVLMH